MPSTQRGKSGIANEVAMKPLSSPRPDDCMPPPSPTLLIRHWLIACVGAVS
jgi:hypothetical protein